MKKSVKSEGWYYGRIQRMDYYLPPLSFSKRPEDKEIKWWGPFKDFEMARTGIIVSIRERIEELERVAKTIKGMEEPK